jgi:8-oxo-dGTP diphosphatase
MAKEEVDVVLAVLLHPNKTHCLLAIRPEGVHLSGYWEFPGGKVGITEGYEQALAREVTEELGLDISTGNSLLFKTVNHCYDEVDVSLNSYLITDAVPADYLAIGVDGKGAEGQVIRWVAFSELSSYHFPVANREIIAALKRNKSLV